MRQILEITEPRIAAALLERSEPAARGIERDNNEEPYEVDDREWESPAGRLGERKVCNVRRFEQPMYLAIARQTDDNCEQMNERDMEKKIEHGHFAED